MTEVSMASALAKLDDNALIGMALEGQGDGFTELMRRHAGAVKGRIQSIVRNPSDVDEVLQEVSLKAWRALSTFRSESSFRTWLTRIATNEALMLYRREGRTRLCQPMGDFDSFQSPSEPADRCFVRAEEARQLHSAVVRLPLIYREAVILCDLEQLSVRETAQRLQSSIPAVKSRLFRGRHLLVEALRRSRSGEFLAAAA